MRKGIVALIVFALFLSFAMPAHAGLLKAGVFKGRIVSADSLKGQLIIHNFNTATDETYSASPGSIANFQKGQVVVVKVDPRNKTVKSIRIAQRKK